MKKIQEKITSIFHRYIILVKNYIIKKLKETEFFIKLKGIFISFITLNFLFSKAVKLSIFSRYLVLLIILLFAFLFYLSIPTLYNFGKIQKDLNKKLSDEFNLNTSLSANITYKILPTPNFEITNVFLTNDSKNKFDDFVQIKKMNIYVYVKSLYNKNKLDIKNVVISEANFNINNITYKYINNYFKNKISSKKIKIKKSKIFFRNNNSKKDVVALATINKLNFFYDKIKNKNKINFDGTIYNTKYDFRLSRNINKKKTDIEVKFKNVNALLKSEFSEDKKKKNTYGGKISLNFPGSEINTEYKVNDKLISINSGKSNIKKNNLNYSGIISVSPFYYNINVNLETLNILKFLENLSELKNLLDDKILLNKKVNGQILFNINNLKGIKIFDKAKIKINFTNGKLILNDSLLISGTFGKALFNNTIIEITENKKIFKSKILFKIENQKKLYQKLQIPKKNRMKLNNIYLEVEKDLDIDEIIINKFILNKKNANTSDEQSIDLSEIFNIDEINHLQNWIELKKFSRDVFSKINKLN